MRPAPALFSLLRNRVLRGRISTIQVIHSLKTSSTNIWNFAFMCPGCGCGHVFRTGEGKPLWEFNGDMEKPLYALRSLLMAIRSSNIPNVRAATALSPMVRSNSSMTARMCLPARQFRSNHFRKLVAPAGLEPAIFRTQTGCFTISATALWRGCPISHRHSGCYAHLHAGHCFTRSANPQGWLGRQTSNLRPSGYEPDALPF